MVDFSKRVARSAAAKPLSPAEIYNALDRASDKGPLRPVQEIVLDEWHRERRDTRDVVLKLHTGEGKTLVGLLMLQSKLNDGANRALYLCPNHFLVEQTLTEARAFGIRCVAVDDSGDLPADFVDGHAILVAPVQKLFNGRTRFGLEAASLRVDVMVLDDAHACIDAIKDSCVVSLRRDHPAYQSLVNLFASDLQDQGAGTFAEIEHDVTTTAFLPVPYWAWVDRHREVADVLVRHVESQAVRFAWPLLRDRFERCSCIVSGRELVVAPHRTPLELFGSYAQAKHRVFMSATLTDDSFLVKGFGLDPQAVTRPLTNAGARWSGEKMVLLPQLIHDDLTPTEVVHIFAQSRAGRTFGVVGLVPSGEVAKIWSSSGAVVATKDDIDAHVQRLRVGASGDRDNAVVFVNRYDGIDLPDASCRVLVLHGKPFGAALLDRHAEACRPGSILIASRVARVIEQGMGRSVRGEKDYCVVVLSGGDLVKAVRTRESRALLSEQTRTQMEIGLEVATFAREEVALGKTPVDALRGLVNQSLRRDGAWKQFYEERMNAMPPGPASPRLVSVYAAELAAERQYERGDVTGAITTLRDLLDAGLNGQAFGDGDRGWYLQEMGRYQYRVDKAESARLQARAHERNHYLLRPREGAPVRKLTPVGQRRVGRIVEWMQNFDDHQSAMVAIDDIIGALRFGVRADDFERALDNAAEALGFEHDRPDKQWKAGPDNLWALREGEFLLFECKSEVEITRAEIAKAESGQLNNSAAWFSREYPGADCTRVLVTPARTLATGAGFNEPTFLLRVSGLQRFTRNLRAFFVAFRGVDMRDIDDRRVQQLLEQHELAVEALRTGYFEEPRTAPTGAAGG